MSFFRQISLIIISAFIVVPVFSQSELVGENVSAIDTIKLNGKYIVLYDNNVWDFVRSPEEIAMDKTITDTMKIFREYWNNDITFTYSYPKEKASPDSVLINLIDTNRKFVIPHEGQINSGFGWRGRRNHKGIDVHLERGTPVKAAFDGKVRYAKYNNGGYGYLVIIRHYNGLETYYAHLSRLHVKPNQIVKAGQVIGSGGNTGASWAGCHLHFECRWHDHAFDPLKVFAYDSCKLRSENIVLKPNDFRITQNHKAYLNNGVNGSNVESKQIAESQPNYKPKQVIKNSASGKVSGNYYYVKKGDTLSAIAVRFHTNTDKLCRLNGISKKSTLQIGQRIKIR